MLNQILGLSPSPINDHHILQRLQQSLTDHLSPTTLNHRLAELPAQLDFPTTRPWRKIDWQSIDSSQIQGIEIPVFLSILKGSMDTEAPIHHYTHVSRQYLAELYPGMATYVGGVVDDRGQLIAPGLWEKEERRHTPALIKIYRQVAGQPPTIDPHPVRAYQPTESVHHDLFKHGLHRTATELAAACLYLWLMAHTTGALHQVLEEIAVDEINHATRFWGFGAWAYPTVSWRSLALTLVKTSNRSLIYRPEKSSLVGTIQRMTQVLGWSQWTGRNRASFIWLALQALLRMARWSNQLDRQQLNKMFGQPLAERVVR